MEGLRGRREGRSSELPAGPAHLRGHLRPPSRTPEPPASAGARRPQDGRGQRLLQGTAGERERETSREHFKRKNKMESSENAPALLAPLGVTARPGDEETGAFPGRRGDTSHLRAPSTSRKLSSRALGKARGRAQRTGCSHQLPATGGGTRRRVPLRACQPLPVSLRPPARPPTAAHLPPALRPPSRRRPPPRQRLRRSRPAAFPRSCRRLRSSRSRRSCLRRKRPPCYFLPRKRLQAGPGPPKRGGGGGQGKGSGCCGQGAPEGGGGAGLAGARNSERAARPHLAWGRDWGRAAPGSCAGLWGFSGRPFLNWSGCVSRPGLLCGVG